MINFLRQYDILLNYYVNRLLRLETSAKLPSIYVGEFIPKNVEYDTFLNVGNFTKVS